MIYKLFAGNPDDVAYESASDETRVVMKKVLGKRGLTQKEEIESFMIPSYSVCVADPFGIHHMKEGAERIVSALKKGEKICVYSDYDCDGIPGGAVLSDFFDAIGYDNRVHYIPHRHKEGYGLHKHAIDTLKGQGVSLVITVDNGITNVDEVAYAMKNGVDMIVTDHHLPLRDENGVQLVPEAIAVINSKKDECTYHDDMLCGAAVAWKLACAVLALLRTESTLSDTGDTSEKKGLKKKKSHADDAVSPLFDTVIQKVKAMKPGYEKWWLDLVAISTIADMVPLQKENRALAYYGLSVLRKSPRAGLQKLFALSKTKQENLSAQDVAFTIAPRVNAASRMSDPVLAFEMLRAKDVKLSMARAEELEKLNTLRKETVKGVKHEVMGYDLSVHTHVVVIGNKEWSPGILGLIAQEVLEETGKPTFVWGAGEDGEVYKGSCRAGEGVDLVALMTASEDGALVSFGGHAQSGGFVVKKEKVESLSDALNKAYETLALSVEKKELETVVDALLSFDEVTHTLHKELEKIEPTGEGNPRPLFAFKSLGALSVREFGKSGGHFEVLYEKERGQPVKAIYFFGEKEKLDMLAGEHVLIAEIEVSYFGWKPELRLRIIDIINNL